MALQNPAESSDDIETVTQHLHQGGTKALLGHLLCAHHFAHGLPKLCELLLRSFLHPQF